MTTIFNYQYTNQISLFFYSYRLDGSLSGKIEDGPSTLYTYNALGQLVAETGDEPTNYSYDDSGNRVSMMKVLPSVTTTYTYDAANRLISRAAGDSVATYNYDANGNMLTETLDGTVIKNFSYDEFDRLVEAYVGGVTEIYTYDGRGRRFSVQNGSTVTRHIWDGDEITYDCVTVESAETGYNYLHGLSAEGVIIGTTIYENLLTAQGDVAATYQNTTRVRNTSYSAFGNASNSSSSIRNPYGYRGEYTDATGLQYLRARYYDPTLGRFTQQDTMPDQGNPYIYCSNNPVLYRDPSGHCKRWGIPDVKSDIMMIKSLFPVDGIKYERVEISAGDTPFYRVTMQEGSDLCAHYVQHYNMTHSGGDADSYYYASSTKFLGYKNAYADNPIVANALAQFKGTLNMSRWGFQHKDPMFDILYLKDIYVRQEVLSKERAVQIAQQRRWTKVPSDFFDSIFQNSIEYVIGLAIGEWWIGPAFTFADWVSKLPWTYQKQVVDGTYYSIAAIYSNQYGTEFIVNTVACDTELSLLATSPHLGLQGYDSRFDTIEWYLELR